MKELVVSNPPASAPAVADTGKELVTVTPQQAKANPFNAIAMILGSMRISLEGTKEQGRAPRWIRMVRIREFQGGSDYISKAVIPALGGLNTAILHLMNLTLQAKDMLAQADAAKAMWEVSAEMLKTVTTDEFATAIAQVIDPEIKEATNPLSGVSGQIDTISKFIDRIPSPEDLDLLGAEFFRLLSIELLPLDEKDLNQSTEKHININTSGKLRLIQMGLNKPITIHGLGKDKGVQEVTYLGGRRLWKADPLPVKAIAQWGDAKKLETIYEFGFTAATDGADLIEANDLLEKLGYVTPTIVAADKKIFGDALEKRLQDFQKINSLTVTGKLDNSTINRLMHFNFETKSIERALPFNAEKLTQPVQPA